MTSRISGQYPVRTSVMPNSSRVAIGRSAPRLRYMSLNFGNTNTAITIIAAVATMSTSVG